jgi:hypothetical protein
MSLNQRVTAEFSTCTPSAPPPADLSIQTIREQSGNNSSGSSKKPFLYWPSAWNAGFPNKVKDLRTFATRDRLTGAALNNRVSRTMRRTRFRYGQGSN